jgi:hypothetical protein
MAQTSFEGEVFSHRQLWVAAKAMRDHAEAEKKGAMYFDMAAMLLARLTVEAYCNFLVDALDPETFMSEKQVFGSDTDKKVQWICEKVGFTLNRGQRPYQTVASLNGLRDRVVHAKPQIYAGEHQHADGTDPPFMQPGELEKLVSPDRRARALEDVEQFCESLHERVLAVATSEQKRRLEPRALSGSLQRETWSSRLSE